MRLKLQGCQGNPLDVEMRENRSWRSTKVRLHPWIAAVVVAACAFAGVPGSTSSSLGLMTAAAQDKDSFTAMPLDSGFGRMDISDPAIPPEQILQRMAAKESEFQDALDHYTYRRTARVQVLDDDNKVKGEWYEVDDVIFDPDGRRTERVVYAPASTLADAGILMTPSDLQDIQHGYPFVLTKESIPEYDVKYVGRQKVDEVDCYVFDVSPKTIVKNKRYLDGRIWVDTTDLQIVVTNGRMVPDDTRKNQRGSAPTLYDLAATDRRTLLVPGLHQGRGLSALCRRLRLHGARHTYPRYH